MLTLQEIREDLKEVRYYYSKQKTLDCFSKTITTSSVLEKVERYNQAVRNAPIRLYDVYISLYVMNNTHEALAFDWDCSPDYIKQQNRKLCEFLLKILS